MNTYDEISRWQSMHEPTFCPYCGHECSAYQDSDAGFCRECDNPCVPVQYSALDKDLQKEWENG